MRRTARAVAATGVVLLALAAAPRLALDYAPRGSSSEIVASIRFPTATAGDPVDMTTRFVVPLETAVRSLGDVIATRGEVGGDGAMLSVRFRAGVDAELKAARLTAELAPLRAKLPEGAAIDVWPSTASGSEPSVIYALTGGDAGRTAERLADELRATTGVREVSTFGGSRDEVDGRTTGGDDSDLGAAIVEGIARRSIGSAPLAAREVSVVSEPGAARLRDVRIGGQRLDALATIRERPADPRFVARVGGRPAVVLQIARDDDVPLFTFDRAVRATLRGTPATEVWSDAAELRKLLWRIAIAALAATIILAIAGMRVAGPSGATLGAYVPLAMAVAVNVWRVGGVRADALGLQATLVAVGGIAPFAAWRVVAAGRRLRGGATFERAPAERGAAQRDTAAAERGTGAAQRDTGAAQRGAGSQPAVSKLALSQPAIMILFATLPLIAASLSSSVLTATLVVPAKMFAIAAAASVAAAMLLPPLPPCLKSGRVERRLLRASFAIVLAAVAAATFLLSWFGKNLDPRQAARGSQRDRFYIRVALPAGTPLAPTVEALARVEGSLAGIDGISRFWSFAWPGRGTVVAEIKPRFQQPGARALLKLRIEAGMPFAGGQVRVDDAFDRGAGARASDLEDRPSADEQGWQYRVLLKGTDAESMRRAEEQIATRLTHQGFHRTAINAEWPEATTQITLVPRPGVPPATVAQLARALAVRTTPPRPRLLPDGRLLVAAAAEAPKSDDDVPRANDLFRRPMPVTPESAFDVRRDPVSGRVTRELGRFVMPVSIGISGYEVSGRLRTRADADRTLALMSFPGGVVLERPALTPSAFSIEKLRLFGLAALLPAMMFALAAIVLSSLRRALVALAPAVVAVACTSPALLALDAPLDELVLLSIGAAVCCVTAMSVLALSRFQAIAAAYRELRASLAVCAGAAVAGAAMAAIAATAGGGLGEAWRAPLLAAAAVFAAGGGCALLLPAAIEALARTAKRTVAQPFTNGPLSLEVQNVTKIYAGGFRALRRVSFTLEPGIVGLLGPNGAGKTTLLRIVTGLLLPTRGVVRFRGVDVRPSSLAGYRAHIGFLPQEFNAYAGLTAAQFLDYWALERGVAEPAARRAEVERLLHIARLETHADRKLRDFSGGMRQRIGIARAMIGDPPLLVVDEPTTGLDIEARAHFRELISALARDRIIILSTHIASDVESTASRLLLLDGGRLCWDGTPAALIARARGRVFETVADDAEALDLARLYRITTRVRVAAGIRLRGIVPIGEPLPGAAVEPMLEEAYLAEITPSRTTRGASFAFVYESVERRASARRIPRTAGSPPPLHPAIGSRPAGSLPPAARIASTAPSTPRSASDS